MLFCFYPFGLVHFLSFWIIASAKCNAMSKCVPSLNQNTELIKMTPNADPKPKTVVATATVPPLTEYDRFKLISKNVGLTVGHFACRKKFNLF